LIFKVIKVEFDHRACFAARLRLERVLSRIPLNGDLVFCSSGFSVVRLGARSDCTAWKEKQKRAHDSLNSHGLQRKEINPGSG